MPISRLSNWELLVAASAPVPVDVAAAWVLAVEVVLLVSAVRWWW